MNKEIFYEDKVFKLYEGSNLDILPTLPDNSVDSIVTDPPYELGFMGKKWDNTGIAYNVKLWKECLRVLKHGGFLLAFSGSRTYHRMAVAIEDAGFLIKDQIMWLYGSGFPKGLDIAKAVDKQYNRDEMKAYNNVSLWIKESGYTDKSIADFCNVSPALVRFWRLKERNIQTQQLQLLCKLLNKPFDKKALIIKKGKVIGFKKGVMSGWNMDGTTKFKDREINEFINDKSKQWDGWKTTLKPTHEPILMAQKPLEKGLTYAQNVLKWGVGALNIDECRIDYNGEIPNLGGRANNDRKGYGFKPLKENAQKVLNENIEKGRYPANLIHDGSDEVINSFPNKNGSAARFFYGAKAQSNDREQGLEKNNDKISEYNSGGMGRESSVEKRILATQGFGIGEKPSNKGNGINAPLRKNIHPTVKPTDLMRYLVKMVSPKGATILDPFFGSGSTGKGAMVENILNDKNYKIIGVELTKEYLPIARDRVIKGSHIYTNILKFGKSKNKVDEKQIKLF